MKMKKVTSFANWLLLVKPSRLRSGQASVVEVTHADHENWKHDVKHGWES